MTEIITIGGQERRLGCLRRIWKPGEVFPLASDRVLVAENKWDERGAANELESWVWHWINQSDQGTCCPSAHCGAGMVIRAIAGLKKKVLSQAGPYAFTGVQNGKLIERRTDHGMAIDACAKVIQLIGVPTIDMVGQYDWVGYRRGKWQDDWRDDAAETIMLEWDDVPTYEHAVSLVFDGQPVVFGYHIGRGGHAVVLMNRRERDKNRALGSWGMAYGDEGFHELPDDTVKRGIDYFGAVSPRVFTDATNDGDV